MLRLMAVGTINLSLFLLESPQRGAILIQQVD